MVLKIVQPTENKGETINYLQVDHFGLIKDGTSNPHIVVATDDEDVDRCIILFEDTVVYVMNEQGATIDTLRG